MLQDKPPLKPSELLSLYAAASTPCPSLWPVRCMTREVGGHGTCGHKHTLKQHSQSHSHSNTLLHCVFIFRFCVLKHLKDSIFNIQYSIFNIQHSIFNIQYSAIWIFGYMDIIHCCVVQGTWCLASSNLARCSFIVFSSDTRWAVCSRQHNNHTNIHYLDPLIHYNFDHKKWIEIVIWVMR